MIARLPAKPTPLLAGNKPRDTGTPIYDKHNCMQSNTNDSVLSIVI